MERDNGLIETHDDEKLLENKQYVRFCNYYFQNTVEYFQEFEDEFVPKRALYYRIYLSVTISI